ncbi:MAG: GNAT family N-acetyltransferase [Verrucomicrobiota bacterium]
MNSKSTDEVTIQGHSIETDLRDGVFVWALPGVFDFRGFVDSVRKTLLLGDLSVEPEHQNQGIASTLLKAIESSAERRGLLTLFGNICAGDFRKTPHLKSFYEKRGFKIVEPRETFAIFSIEKAIDLQDDGAQLGHPAFI